MNNNQAGNQNNNGNAEITVPYGMGFEAYQGSIQQILKDNTGQYVDVEFLIGSGALTTRSGILYAVGVNYIVLYDRKNDRYLICDLYSIKFVTIYNTGNRN